MALCDALYRSQILADPMYPMARLEHANSVLRFYDICGTLVHPLIMRGEVTHLAAILCIDGSVRAVLLCRGK